MLKMVDKKIFKIVRWICWNIQLLAYLDIWSFKLGFLVIGFIWAGNQCKVQVDIYVDCYTDLVGKRETYKK